MAQRNFSPLTIVLGCVYFFSVHVFAAPAALGVDLGTEYIKAALVKPGIPLDIVLTKDSRRKEISAVTFKPLSSGPKSGSYPERLYGSDAIALAARFPHDVYPNLKTILGLSTDHPIVQEYAARHPALQLEKNKELGTAAFKSKAFTEEEEAWLVEELLAMELQSIQKNAEVAAGDSSSIRSIVLTVPPYFTAEEKRALQTAADLAGLKVLSLISDGLAVGLNYATSRQFPNINEGGKPEYHLVFDMGAGSTKATVMKFQSRLVKDIGKFNKTVQEVAVIGTGWDRTLGGDALNSLIIDDMVTQFVESKGAQKISAQSEKVKAHGRAIAKLTKEAERVRHILSANTNTGASFEGLYEDVDFKYKISRAEFEKMAEGHASRVEAVVQNALKMAGLELSDLTSVILHGGASRTPFVQKQLESVVGSADKIRTNVNSDEAAVFGAGFRAAELSPSFRVKEIRISEGANFPSGMKWTNNKNKLQHQRLWSAISPQGGVAKDVTFTNHDDFSVTFYQQIDSAEQDTKILTTKNLTASVAQLKEKYSCVDSDIHFKVGVKLSGENGEVEVTKATVECEADAPEKEGFVDGVKNLFGFGKKDQKPLDGEEGESSSASTESSSTTTPSTESKTSSASASASPSDASADDKEAPKKELVVIDVDFTLEKTGRPELSRDELIKSKDRLKAFEASDRARRLREEALNQLEAFTYKVRDLLESESFIAFSTEKERTTLEKKNSEASDWLYEDGADASREELKKRYKELHDPVSKIQKRVEEAEKRPELIKGLKDALNSTQSFVGNIKKQIEEYDAWHASASASASESPSTSTETPSATPSGDFDGLEDDEASAGDKERKMEDVVKERGPVPPLYKLEDLDVVEGLYEDTLKWLKEAEKKQEALAATADPVLLVKDLQAKRDKLDKAGMDLAMKGVKHFEKKSKKATKSAKAKKTKSASSSTTNTASASSESGKKPTTTIPLKSSTAEPEPAAGRTVEIPGGGSYVQFGGSGDTPTEEELEEILKKFEQHKAPGQEQEDAPEHDEL
ncbi:heat shock protein 70-like protein [Colletotrichum truncatum]|uniref:Heat shock protein 70-like protein n=1 Tax=Colletotrichum truncatum TaxID=5467 RepID=A0ACC3ZB80_COLTU|nr:heat shock protein 70-like protein [Colletotrichum truncatum]KAF6783154.1 heat shock protein 70-like protein [Colletotrichum truncatum]